MPHLFLIKPDGTTSDITTGHPIKDILDTNECYVIVADEVRKVYLWKGMNSSVRSKFIGAKRSQEIRGQVGLHYAVVPLDEGEEEPEFLRLIGRKGKAVKTKEISKVELNIEELQEKLKKQQLIINELQKQIQEKQKEVRTPLIETDLSNKDRILHLLKSEALTSKEIADKLRLSKQDARTYLLRLKKEDKVKTLEKKGRYYIYTYKPAFSKDRISDKKENFREGVEILSSYVNFEKSFRNEINEKIAKLEAKINVISSKELGTQKQSFYEGFEENLQVLETSRSIDLDATLRNLLDTIPEVNAAILVSTEGKVIASALPHGVNEIRIATMMAGLLSIAEKSVIELKKGEFDQLYVKGSDGYLLVLQAGPNAVLTVSTTKDVRVGLIFLDAKRTCEKIAKLI